MTKHSMLRHIRFEDGALVEQVEGDRSTFGLQANHLQGPNITNRRNDKIRKSHLV